MKTIIFLMLFASSVFGQTVDTATFSIVTGEGGYYTSLMNKSDYMGVPAGTGRFAIQFDAASIDTSSWQFVTGYGGYYMFVTNRAEWYGIPAGTVRAQVVSGITSIGTGTTEYGTCTLNTEWGIVTSDQLPGEGTNECTITVNNSLCKTTSAIVFSVLLLDEGDRNPNTPVTCNISTISDGSFVLRAGKSGGNFSANIVFYYHLQN